MYEWDLGEFFASQDDANGFCDELESKSANFKQQYEKQLYALSQEKDIYDFRGVSGVLDETHPQYGLYRFKKGFNAEFTEFIGEIYFDFKPFVYKTYKISEKIFKKARGFIRRLKGEVKWNH